MTIHFLTETTQNCANFVCSLLVIRFFNYFLLIFQICTVQWLNCTNLKYELNRSYNGGGVVYLRKSEASRSTWQYAKISSWAKKLSVSGNFRFDGLLGFAGWFLIFLNYWKSPKEIVPYDTYCKDEWDASLSVHILLLHHYKSDLAHVSDFIIPMTKLSKSERWAKSLL